MTTGIDPQQSEASQQSNEADRGLVPLVSRSLRVVVETPATRTNRALADAPPITPRRLRPSARSKWRRRLVMLMVLAAGGVGLAVYWNPIKEKFDSYINPKNSLTLANIQTYSVKRGELRITMLEEGKLRAVNNSTIRMGISGKITWVAPPGAAVKKGDKLATVDAKQYEDQKRTMEQDLEQQQRLKTIAESAIPIAEADGNAAISTANNALATAELALKQYKEIDSRKKLNDLDTAVNDARTKLSDQQKRRGDLQTQLDAMLNEGDEKNKLQNDLRNAKQAEDSLRRAVATAEDQKKLFRSNNYPQELKTKERAVENAKLEVEKAKIKKNNDVLAKQGEVGRLNNLVNQRLSNIKQMDDYIARSTAYSPTDGLVYYGGPDLDRYGMSPDSIKVGADWSSQYPIMSIPDLSAFQVAVPVAEVYRGRVGIGMPATVLIDAVPGLVLGGKLMSISSVSRPKFQYDNTSPPVYDAVLSLAVADPRMVAGMTVRVEIVTATLPDVLYVPVEAVYNEEGKTAAFLWIEGGDPNGGHVEKRPVLTGQSNDHFVAIVKGAREGDRLLLSQPALFITPQDYREQADAMFPATTAPSMTAGRGGPSSGPNDVMRAEAAIPSTLPALSRRGPGATAGPADAMRVEAMQPTSRPAGARRGGPPSSMPAEGPAAIGEAPLMRLPAIAPN